MASGGIYRKCEEPTHKAYEEGMPPRRAGGFLMQYCRCGSDGTSISVLFIVNAVTFVLWTIIFAIMISKYSELSKELEHLHGQVVLKANDSDMERLRSNQSTYASKLNSSFQKLEADQDVLRKDVTKCKNDIQSEKTNILTETFKLQEEMYKKNGSACQFCPNGWMLNRGHCYAFQRNEQHWSFAKTSCEDQGSQLVIINDFEEQDFLTKNLKGKTYWIGLSDIEAEGTFVWVDKSPLQYSHWSSREPNNADQGQDCAAMRSSGWWEDRACGGITDGWVCEKPWKC